MQQDIIYPIALTLVPTIGDIQARILLEHFENANAIFKASQKKLETIEGIGTIRAKNITSFTNFARAEKECQFIEKHHIQAISYKDSAYPNRLRYCYDAPPLLFYKGNANLNHTHIISIVGTRSPTSYGEWVTQQIVEQLTSHNVIIVSGLAYGIDVLAHRTAMKNNTSTIGVLAHGFDRIYPSQHRNVAKEMMLQGGLLTNFMSNTKPDRQNFPKRNRIVAGISDAVIVVETNEKGGSMITAELAFDYNRDVWAVPGRINDPKSKGCLHLIKNQKAIPFITADAMVQEMGWMLKEKKQPCINRSLFIDMTPEEQTIFNVLQKKESTHIDELFLKSKLSNSVVATSILQLELKGIIKSFPGKMYKLV